jgi:hypothetical protein
MGIEIDADTRNKLRNQWENVVAACILGGCAVGLLFYGQAMRLNFLNRRVMTMCCSNRRVLDASAALPNSIMVAHYEAAGARAVVCVPTPCDAELAARQVGSEEYLEATELVKRWSRALRDASDFSASTVTFIAAAAPPCGEGRAPEAAVFDVTLSSMEPSAAKKRLAEVARAVAPGGHVIVMDQRPFQSDILRRSAEQLRAALGSKDERTEVSPAFCLEASPELELVTSHSAYFGSIVTIALRVRSRASQGQAYPRAVSKSRLWQLPTISWLAACYVVGGGRCRRRPVKRSMP